MDTAVVMGVGPDRGMGGRLCRRFAKLGKHVFVAGRTQAKLDSIVAGIAADGGSATAVVADATSEDGVVALFAAAAKTGRIDVAIYNAGNNTPGRLDEMTAEYFENSWRICCFGGFLFAREAIRQMKDGGGGTVLFTGASASLRGRPNFRRLQFIESRIARVGSGHGEGVRRRWHTRRPRRHRRCHQWREGP